MPLIKKAAFLSSILLFQCAAVIFSTVMFLDGRYAGKVQQGITVNGVPVGGLSPVEAVQRLESTIPDPPLSALRIKDAGKSYVIYLPDIDGIYDYRSTIEEALAYGKKGNIFDRFTSTPQLRAAPIDLAIKIAFSEEKLAEKIKCLKDEWETPAEDAEVKLSDDKVIITPEKKGYSLDLEKTLEQVSRDLACGNLNVAASGRILEPPISTSDLNGIDTLLSEYITTFNNSDENRSHNIALASAAINGTLLKPGEVFSLNRQLGPRLAESGYLEAPVFIGNGLSLDFGGGVCQVATTLYNTVLLSDLEVVERYPHPQPVSYVSPGRDATIAGDYLDLKFTNNTGAPVYISSLVESGTLTVSIFGEEKSKSHTVRITSEKTVFEPKVIVVEDNTLPEGETEVVNSGRVGYEARVYREVVVDGQVQSRNQISSDYYISEDKIVHVGPKPEGTVKK